MKRKGYVAIGVAILIVSFLITACGSSESTESSSNSETTSTETAAKQTEVSETNTVEEESGSNESDDKIQLLKDRDVYYGYGTMLGNLTAGLIEASEFEDAVVIDSGIKFIDVNNDLFPANDPGVDYYNSVDFSVEQRTIEKYPTKEYGLMRVGGCVSEILYTEYEQEMSALMERDGYTLIYLSGYAESSNQYENYIVVYYGDLPNVYKGSSIYVIGTPVALVTEQGDLAVVLVASMVSFSDNDLTNTIVYGKTEAESSVEMVYGYWYYSLMSLDKMKEESVRLQKEKLGLSAESTDEDIPAKLFNGYWQTEDNSGVNLEIDTVKKALETAEKLGVDDDVEKFNKYLGEYDFHIEVFNSKCAEFYDYFGKVNGNKLEFSTEVGPAVLSLSFEKAEYPMVTMAEEWFQDGSGSKNGIYLHCSLTQEQMESLRGSASDSDTTTSAVSEEDSSLESNGSESFNDFGDEPEEFFSVIPDSASRYLTDADIANLSKEDLRLAKNEIYARHGYIFKSEDLNAYFSSMYWYEPKYTSDQFDENVFNEYEKYNLEFLNKAIG